MRTHCRQWACGYCDCLGIFLIYRLTTFDVRIRRQKSSKSANMVFYISLNKGYFGKAIFSRLFSARYHIFKKKKKKKKRYWAYVDVVLIITLSILATCLVSSNCSVTHVRWGEGTSSVLFQWRPAFSALWRCGNSVVSVHHINNFWNTRSNLTTFSGQSPQWLRMVCAKLHVKRLRIDWDINEKRSAGVVTTLAQCFALTLCRIRSDRQTTSLTLKTGVCETGTKMRGASNMNIHYDVTGLLTAAWKSHSGQIVWAAWINCQLAREEEGGGGFWTHSTYTGYPGSAGGRQLDRWRCALMTFEVLNQTPPNLLGSCRSSSRWHLPNCIKNGWELTSELTSKWIYIFKYSSKFHTNLINNFWSTRSNSTEFTGQWP